MSPAAGKPVAPLFQIDNEVTRCIRKHARAHMKTEVCGVLIGETRDGVVEITASIEALNAAQAGTHVTFTQDAWETIYKVKDESYPDQRIVGWYHSHPGFGVFLSEHDSFIHRNFFSSPDQVAWVYDPHSDEEGCFGWVNGAIHRISNLSIIDNNGDGVERTPKETGPTPEEDEEESGAIDRMRDLRSRRAERNKGWRRWVASALACIFALVLGFSISYFLYPRVVVLLFDPASGQLMQLPPELVHRLLQHQPPEVGANPFAQPTPPLQPTEPAAGSNSGRSK
jgi:proteasome lid subunit RPN8/RPN11